MNSLPSVFVVFLTFGHTQRISLFLSDALGNIYLLQELFDLLSSLYVIIMIQPISINTGSLARSQGQNQTYVKHICHTRIRCTQDEHTNSHFLPRLLIVSLIDLSPSGTLLLQHSPTIALMRCLCRCAYVCRYECVCMRLSVPEKERRQRSLWPCLSPPLCRSRGRSEAGLPVSISIPTAAVSQAQWSQEDEKTMDFFFSCLHSQEQEDQTEDEHSLVHSKQL